MAAMQPASRRRPILRLGTLWLVAAIAVLAGCSTLEALLPGSGPLVTIRTEGGLCAEGACSTAWIVMADGRIVSDDRSGEVLGRASGESMIALRAAIATTDYSAIRAKPFTGECPTAFDGQEVILEFHTPGRVERIASCETEIDWSHPLFATLVSALSAVPGGAIGE